MAGQELPRFANRMHERIGKILRLKMRPHCFCERLPERLTTPVVHAAIADDGKLLRAGRDENKDGVAVARASHAEPFELPASFGYRVRHFAALNENPDFAGGFRLRLR